MLPLSPGVIFSGSWSTISRWNAEDCCLLIEADENSEGMFFCVLRPRVRLYRIPGVESPGKGCPHIVGFLRYGLLLNSFGHQNRVVKRAG